MDHDKQTPPSGQDTDVSKAQNQQQPFGQQNQGDFKQPPEGQSQQQAPEGQADYGSAGQSDTTTQQRTDIEGGTATGQATDVEGSSTFVGSQAATDTSGALIEEDDDFTKDRKGDGE